MQSCLNEDCHERVTLASNPSDFCSEKCWVDCNYSDMFARRLILKFLRNRLGVTQ